uniref:hypothetical protein n=1 Tax=Aquimarina rhodophyticola TaxID=3342246 RepID=UPI00406BCF32
MSLYFYRMKSVYIKSVLKVICICIGITLLVYELIVEEKNYYVQSVGIICLMGGMYMVNAGLTSRSQSKDNQLTNQKEV